MKPATYLPKLTTVCHGATLATTFVTVWLHRECPGVFVCKHPIMLMTPLTAGCLFVDERNHCMRSMTAACFLFWLQLCNKPAVCGYAYGNNTGIKPVAMEGFTGDAAGQKMFVFSVQMPAATAAGEPNYPAVWMLNARLSRLINCCTSTHTASLQSHQVPSHQGPRALSLALA